MIYLKKTVYNCDSGTQTYFMSSRLHFPHGFGESGT